VSAVPLLVLAFALFAVEILAAWYGYRLRKQGEFELSAVVFYAAMVYGLGATGVFVYVALTA